MTHYQIQYKDSVEEACYFVTTNTHKKALKAFKSDVNKPITRVFSIDYDNEGIGTDITQEFLTNPKEYKYQ